MTRAEAVSLKDAAALTGLSVKTLRRMHQRHRIGRQASACAPIELSYPAVVMLQHGDTEAVELLRSGRRSDPRVSRYLDLLGLQEGHTWPHVSNPQTNGDVLQSS